jgi:hypothetical protein
MADIFKEIIPSILQTKTPVINESNESDYVPFVVNRAMSQHYDCVMQANQINILSHTDKLLQYHFYLNSIRPYKRPFQKWHKKETVESLSIIKEYYRCSNEKAREIAVILSEVQIDELKKRLDKGGLKNDKSKRSRRSETE